MSFRLTPPFAHALLMRSVRCTIPAILGLASLVATVSSADIINLGDISADSDPRGFSIPGLDDSFTAGTCVAGAGDVNGDGVDDIVITANDGFFLPVPVAYVVFGKAEGTTVDLSAIRSGQGGFVMFASSPEEQAGTDVSGAGDVNGDGLADILVSAPMAAPNGAASGLVYVVFGKTDTAAVQLSQVAEGNGGFAIRGASDGDMLSVASAAGDMNSDGFADVVVGSTTESTVAEWAGAAYVVFGKADGEAIELAQVASDADPRGFAIYGAVEGERAGWSVSGAGDVNGDGRPDVVIGALGNASEQEVGACYVVFGKASGTSIHLSNFALGQNQGAGFVIYGEASNDKTGWSVSGAGDVNGDGLEDVVIGAPSTAVISVELERWWPAGKAYVVFGKSTGTPVQLATLGEEEQNAAGFQILAANEFDQAGFSVAGVADVNNDGLAEVVVSSQQLSGPNPPPGPGIVYIVYGKADAAPVRLEDLEDPESSKGIAMPGVASGDRTGCSIDNAGDVNNDGVCDVIIGARAATVNGVWSGTAYVVFGPSPATEVWVDFAYAGHGVGTFEQPFDTLAEAAESVSRNGTIWIKGGSGAPVHEKILLTKPVTINAGYAFDPENR